MPRLTNKHYIEIHHRLRKLWLHRVGDFAALTPREQWNLHRYFKPSKDLSEQVLLEHRRTITRQHPSLPQQAGRALSSLSIAFAQTQLQKHQPARVIPTQSNARNRRAIVTSSVVRPQIDGHKLAEVLRMLVLEERREGEAEESAAA